VSESPAAEAVRLDAAAPLVQPRGLGRQLAALREGAVDAVLATVASIEDARTTVRRLGSWLEVARSGRLAFRLATSVAEIRAAKRAGELAVVLHLQGGAPLEGDVDLIEVYHRLGVRVLQLTYNYRNLLGDGCLEASDAGLSAFGRRALTRLGELGIVVDVSHVGVRTSLEAIEVSAGPVVATHANARALCDHPRNLSDEQLRLLAGRGGVVGLCAFPAFLTRGEDAALHHLLDHAAYIAALVGSEHVGLGLDFADEDEEDFDYYGYDERYYPRPPWRYPQGIASFADVPNIRGGLEARGFSGVEAAGILGENFLRVFAQAWRG
jgi:membrane dipeptidase